MFGIGETELVIIVVFGFLLFGPDKLPGMGRTIGRALRQFREAQEGFTQVVQTEVMDPLNDAMNTPLKKAAAEEDADIEGSDGELAARKSETFAERKARLQAERKAREEAEKRAAAEAAAEDEDAPYPADEQAQQPAAAEGSEEAPAAEGAQAEPAAEDAQAEPAADAQEEQDQTSVAALYALTPRRRSKTVEEPQAEPQEAPAAQSPAPEASGKEDGSEA